MDGSRQISENSHRWSLDEIFQVDSFVGSYKVDTVQGHARRIFVQKVYTVLAIGLVLTLANGLLCLILGQLFLDPHIKNGFQSQQSELMNCIVAISLCLTFLTWAAASYAALQLLQLNVDFTKDLLGCWAAQLIWFFVYLGLWLFLPYVNKMSGKNWILVFWCSLGLVLTTFQLVIHTQMVSGGSGDESEDADDGVHHQRCYFFTSNQLILASLCLYWNLVFLFALFTPLTGAIISAIQAATSSIDFLGNLKADDFR